MAEYIRGETPIEWNVNIKGKSRKLHIVERITGPVVHLDGKRLEMLGSGVSRHVYKVKGEPLVIKLEMGIGFQNEQEIESYALLRGKQKRFVSKVHGISVHPKQFASVVVADFVKGKHPRSVPFDVEEEVLGALPGMRDLHEYNIIIQKTKRGKRRWKVIDLGCWGA